MTTVFAGASDACVGFTSQIEAVRRPGPHQVHRFVNGQLKLPVGGRENCPWVIMAEDVAAFRAMNVAPHFAQKKYTTIDARTTRHPGYHLSQKVRKRVEEIFGWLKTIGGERKVRHIGTELVGFGFTLATAAYNLVRIRNIELAKAV